MELEADVPVLGALPEPSASSDVLWFSVVKSRPTRWRTMVGAKSLLKEDILITKHSLIPVCQEDAQYINITRTSTEHVHVLAGLAKIHNMQQFKDEFLRWELSHETCYTLPDVEGVPPDRMTETITKMVAQQAFQTLQDIRGEMPIAYVPGCQRQHDNLHVLEKQGLAVQSGTGYLLTRKAVSSLIIGRRLQKPSSALHSREIAFSEKTLFELMSDLEQEDKCSLPSVSPKEVQV